MFSTDLVLLTADLPTLLGVATGIALFTGVICFVLRLFVGGRPRDHFANANLAPSHILFSSDTGTRGAWRGVETTTILTEHSVGDRTGLYDNAVVPLK